MKKIIITFISLIIGILSRAQTVNEHYYFKNLSSQNGLSQNTVSAILQDSKGFMWFGTKDGLDRYDGVSFRHFKYDRNNPRSLGNNFVTSLYEDIEGNIWVGTDVGVYIYYPEKDTFRHFVEQSDKNTRVERAVAMISGDSQGRVWIAAEAQNLFCYDLKKQTLRNYILTDHPLVSTNVKCLTVDNSGTIWIGFYGDGLFYSKDELKTLHPYISPIDNEETYNNDVVSEILPGAYNCLYIGSLKGGVKELNLTSGKLRDLLLKDEDNESIYCRTLLFATDNELWIGTESGAYIYNLRTGKYTHLRSSEYDPYSLSDNAIYSFCKDREDGIWIGSYFGGVNYYPRSYTHFEKYYPKGEENSLHGKRVREFCRDNYGVLWIGTEDGGLNRFNLNTKEFSFFAPSAGFTNIHGLCLVDDKLWVGTFSKGLKIIDTRTGTVLKTYQKNSSPRSLIDNSIFAICRTATGDIYLGTMFGLVKYNKQSDDFDRIPELNGKFVYDIKEDSGGNIWLATYANGAYCYNVNDRKWKNYVHDEKDTTSLSYNKVSSIFEDSYHRIWLTTQGGGFCLFHPESETFTSYNSTDGLPSDVVYQIVEDKDGQLWLTTNNGLVYFQPKTETMKVYTTANGLLGDQFNYRSSFEDENGMIYFGGIDGFIAFNPKSFSENKNLPTVVITDFLLFNKEVYADEPNSPLEKNITFSDKIVLRADQNSFSFRISALGYQAPGMNKLMYKLEGFDNEWLSIGESPLITYANLRYGDYIFRVKAANDNGVWNNNEISLSIRILPPFYLSIWAYCIYILLIIGCSVYLVLYFKRRTNRKHRRQMEKFEQEKEREIYYAKIDFFTNVAHEIRTPLTLINGPLENILLKKTVDPEIREDLNIMKQNTERLLSLTNQLLDFRKTESQGFRLNFAECNVTEVLKETYNRFTSLARQRELDFVLNVAEQDFYAHVNKEAFTKIVSNLLNNALKYARHTITIDLFQDEADFTVRIVSDGEKIPEASSQQIFEPFYQMEKKDTVRMGVGIGLPLARSLATLHKGRLYLDIEQPENTFVLIIPLNKEEVRQQIEKVVEQNIEVLDEETSTETDQMKGYTLLLVEDNESMRSFIFERLEVLFTVETAVNGQEALDVLRSNHIDLVISDIMMPVMNGYELCKEIKGDIDLCHIPVIFLTAKNDLESKINGLKIGAEAYVEKPFSFNYLKSQILSLLSNRRKEREAFSKRPFFPVHNMQMNKADEEFMNKVINVIQENISDENFNVERMADILCMSRSSLLRKIKILFNLSPIDFIRLIRLKKAAELIQEGKYRIGDICYMVGINSSSYFSKLFLKQFGMTPKEFEKQYQTSKEKAKIDLTENL